MSGVELTEDVRARWRALSCGGMTGNSVLAVLDRPRPHPALEAAEARAAKAEALVEAGLWLADEWECEPGVDTLHRRYCPGCAQANRLRDVLGRSTR